MLLLLFALLLLMLLMLLRLLLLVLQGQLLRTLIETTKAPHATSREGWLFLFVLLLLALCCCCFVTCTSPVSPFSYYYNQLPPLLQFLQPSAEQLQQELEQLQQQQHRRKPSTWRLLLSLSHIITSVVPPEFPMLLSLTLTVGVLHLAKAGVCCTDTLKYAAAAAASRAAFAAGGPTAAGFLLGDRHLLCSCRCLSCLCCCCCC